tara:strand:- start:550 stop:1041 length:492 start_codon:yes stop_codon:yes gene_type:complete
MQSPHLNSFIDFWNMNFNSPCPPLPRKQSDLNITELEQLRIFDGGKLFQNLFRTTLDSGKLPADLEKRLREGAMWVEDESRLREHGWENEANKILEARLKFEKDQLDKATAESAARSAKREQEMEAYRNLDPMAKLAMNPPSAEAVARTRAEWGITGKAEWEK